MRSVDKKQAQKEYHSFPGLVSPSETQMLLDGTMEYLRAKVYFKSLRARKNRIVSASSPWVSEDGLVFATPHDR